MILLYALCVKYGVTFYIAVLICPPVSSFCKLLLLFFLTDQPLFHFPISADNKKSSVIVNDDTKSKANTKRLIGLLP